MREAIIHDMLLEGQVCVTFIERVGNTTSMSFKCYPDKLTAIREKSFWQYDKIWKELATK